jgi:hypothetical protein
MELQGGTADGGGECLPRMVKGKSKVKSQKVEVKFKIPVLSLQKSERQGRGIRRLLRWQDNLGARRTARIDRLDDLSKSQLLVSFQ